MKHQAPNYKTPPYVRPSEYKDSELVVAQNSTAAAGPEQSLRQGRDLGRTSLHVPQNAGMFLISPLRRKTRSLPIGVNLSE